jgi:hypothetical protein
MKISSKLKKRKKRRERMEQRQWLEELVGFIGEANKKTWAGNGAEVPPDKVQRQGYKELEYQRGRWILRDSYVGYFRAPGMTTVYHREKPVWTMSYGGTGQRRGKEDLVKPTFEFLKRALLQAPSKLPLRGPRELSEAGWQYQFISRGDITDFMGAEQIFFQGTQVFEQVVLGGIIIDIDDQGKPVYPWNLE